MSRAKVDKPFLITSLVLIVFGFLIFSSAALGLLARGSANYSSVAFSQTVLGLFLGSLAFLFALRFDYKIWIEKSTFLLLRVKIFNSKGISSAIVLFVPPNNIFLLIDYHS